MSKAVLTAEVGKYLSVVAYFGLLALGYFQLEQHSLLNLSMYVAEFDLSRMAVALAFLFVVAYALPSRPTLVSHYFLWLHATFPIVPILVFYSFSGGNLSFVCLVVCAFALIRFLVGAGVQRRILKIRIPFPILTVWCLTGALFVLILAGGNYGGISYSLDEIYENRELIAESQSGLFEYTHTLLSKSFLPFLLLYYYVRKDRLLFVGALLASFGVFFLSQHRAAVFFPILTLVCYEATRNRGNLGGWRIMGAFAAIVLVSLLLLSNQATLPLGDIALRRTFMAPAILDYEYFDFFQKNPYTMFSDSKVSLGLISPVYPTAVPHIISDRVGALGGHANSGYLGSGYQQAGYLGVFLYVLVIVVLLKVLDAIGRTIGNQAFVFSVCASPIFWLINSSDLPGVFLTHGLLASLLLCWMSAAFLSERPLVAGYSVQTKVNA